MIKDLSNNGCFSTEANCMYKESVLSELQQDSYTFSFVLNVVVWLLNWTLFADLGLGFYCIGGLLRHIRCLMKCLVISWSSVVAGCTNVCGCRLCVQVVR